VQSNTSLRRVTRALFTVVQLAELQ